MITKLSHSTVWVIDQDRAKDFYCNKLGFEVGTDATMGAFRWLTVRPKTQPDHELILMKVSSSPMMDEAKAAMVRQLVESGSLGPGVLDVDDIRKTYAELVAKGVTFQGEPTERPYGIEALMKDSEGNWYSVVQRKS
jgi:catechol 2,3-dioxygenase-like lactoylglutathione lyase family enzyme